MAQREEATPAAGQSGAADGRVEVQTGRRSVCATLCRPRKLNALTQAMIDGVARAARQCGSDRMLVLTAVGRDGARIGEAFCAGGDVEALARAAHAGEYARCARFLSSEYTLDGAIARLPRGAVSLVRGVAMGGGAGLVFASRFRVVGERILFAMPETDIGFYPEVGASYYLPRMPGFVGLFLSLTGHRVRTPLDALYCGFATHHVPDSLLPKLLDELMQCTDLDDVPATIARHAQQPTGECELHGWRAAIDRCFSAPSVLEIVKRLETERRSGTHREWAGNTLETLSTRSPKSLCVAFETYHRGARMPLEQALEMEFHASMRVMRSADFYEGVRAKLIDRDGQPRWSPARLEDVTAAHVEPYFQADAAHACPIPSPSPRSSL